MKRSRIRIVAVVAASAVAAMLSACGEEPLVPEKGAYYQGPADRELGPETTRALGLRSRHQSFN